MISLAEFLVEAEKAAEQPCLLPAHERISDEPNRTLYDTQILALVQQLFFQREGKPVRHVAFAAVDVSVPTAALCFEVAGVLAELDSYDIALVDACPDSPPLQNELRMRMPVPSLSGSIWPIGPRFWFVARQHWLTDAEEQSPTERSLLRLSEVTSEFDFSILSCGPVSWRTASIARACDGLALVLAANKTRRMVAAQIKAQLSKAQVPLLGTILTNRRFPLPKGLYRSL